MEGDGEGRAAGAGAAGAASALRVYIAPASLPNDPDQRFVCVCLCACRPDLPALGSFDVALACDIIYDRAQARQSRTASWCIVHTAQATWPRADCPTSPEWPRAACPASLLAALPTLPRADCPALPSRLRLVPLAAPPACCFLTGAVLWCGYALVYIAREGGTNSRILCCWSGRQRKPHPHAAPKTTFLASSRRRRRRQSRQWRRRRPVRRPAPAGPSIVLMVFSR